MINYINFFKFKIFTWVRCKNSSKDTVPQALNNSYSHCIRKFQILSLSIVSERVRDSTKTYRPIYKCSYWVYIFKVTFSTRPLLKEGNYYNCDINRFVKHVPKPKLWPLNKQTRTYKPYAWAPVHYRTLRTNLRYCK